MMIRDDGRPAHPCIDSHDAEAVLVPYNALTFGPQTTDVVAFLTIVSHPGTVVFGAFLDEELAGMLTLHVLPNVTWGARPYALVEKVITASRFRRQGIGRQLMAHAIDQAWQADTYMIMSMTGKRRAAKGFYEAVGFSAEDKFAMVIRKPDA